MYIVPINSYRFYLLNPDKSDLSNENVNPEIRSLGQERWNQTD